ncbi:acyl carrier protein [Saccharopolyspora pogona]|uniref:acyl carrier protein n=1 Tax=Saccharopolyspora pogona TaxID=333966 RepID=UPI00168676E2|nr:acyl carrier protein [Saccharopolyspora pogona]
MSTIRELQEHITETYLPDVDPSELDRELDLLDSGVVDSLGVLRLIAWIDKRYGLALGNADVTLDDFRTISAISDLIDRERRPVARPM